MPPLCHGRKSDRERDSCEGLWGRRGRRKELGMSTRVVRLSEQLIRLSQNCDTLLFFPFLPHHKTTTQHPLISWLNLPFVDHSGWDVELDLRLKAFTINKAHAWILSHSGLISIDVTPSKQKEHDVQIIYSVVWGELRVSLFLPWLGLVVCQRQPAAHSRDVSVGYHQRGPGRHQPACYSESNLILPSDSLGSDFHHWDSFQCFFISPSPHPTIVHLHMFSHRTHNHKANPWWLRALMWVSLSSPWGKMWLMWGFVSAIAELLNP